MIRVHVTKVGGSASASTGPAAQECVSLLDPSGCEFARGLISIAAAELSVLLVGAEGPSRAGSSGGEGCTQDDGRPCDLSLEVVVHR